jgi:hypothetical protein
MSQVVIEFNNYNDLNMVVTLAKRLNGNILSMKNDTEELKKSAKMNLMKKARKDQLFLTDINEIEFDFKYIDSESL